MWSIWVPKLKTSNATFWVIFKHCVPSHIVMQVITTSIMYYSDLNKSFVRKFINQEPLFSNLFFLVFWSPELMTNWNGLHFGVGHKRGLGFACNFPSISTRQWSWILSNKNLENQYFIDVSLSFRFIGIYW